MPPFVISFEYLAKPVSPKFAIILQLLFVFVVTLKFCQTFDWFYQKFVDFEKKMSFS